MSSIYDTGTAEDRSKIGIGSDAGELASATEYDCSESELAERGNRRHCDGNGESVVRAKYSNKIEDTDIGAEMFFPRNVRECGKPFETEYDLIESRQTV